MATYTNSYPTPNNIIPPFSGIKIDCPSFRERIISTAAQTSFSHPRGLLGTILSEEAFTAIHGNPFIPIADPGIPPPTPTSTDTQRAWDAHKYLKQQHLSQQREIRAFQFALWNALDQDTKRRLKSSQVYITRTPLEIYIHLENTFGTFDADDIRRTKARALKKYDNMSPISSLISTHRDVHNILKSNSQPISGFDEVELLTNSLSDSPRYITALLLWRTAHPSLAQQTFDSLAQHLLDHDAKSQDATTGNLGYAGQASSDLQVSPHQNH